MSSRPPPPDGQSSSDQRKRRHTGSEPLRRSCPYPPSALEHSHRSPDGTRGAPFDLTSPPSVRSYQIPQHSTMRPLPSHSLLAQQLQADRQSSEVVSLPRWQPDTEVDDCPVCGTTFTWIYRKHHCRKCGRVVCEPCSRHRITIPREYVVRPDGVSSVASGGEEVRVCNPCVPDPWTPMPAPDGDERRRQARDTTTQAWINDMHNDERTWNLRAAERATNRAMRASSSTMRPSNISTPEYQHSRNRMSYDFSVNSLSRARHHSTGSQYFGDMSNLASSQRHLPPQSSIAPGYSTHPVLSSAGSVRPPTYPPPPLPRQPPPRPPTDAPPPPPPHSRPPRRQIAEEDECPVCGEEMPPGEARREAHITACIHERSFSTSTPPVPAAHPISNPADSSSSAQPPSQPVNRARATSYKSRGMITYRATEKDCVTEDGEAQECIICLEEFEAGDELGRMECWCKFHRTCIRGWWATKGAGSCPTHQLHE